MIVVYDDMDTPVGKLRIKTQGSSGGHNGLKSIIARTGRQDFKRIKIGIGHPEYNVIDFVLAKPTKEERDLIDEAQDLAVDAIKLSIKDSFNKAMPMYNKK